MNRIIDEGMVASVALSLKEKNKFDITKNRRMYKDLYNLQNIAKMGEIDLYFTQSGDCTILAYTRGHEILKTKVVTI